MRVLIVDDHALFADAITPSLQAEGMRIVAVASTAEHALEAVERERPDLILMDLGLPDMSGLEAGRSILKRSPDAKLIALTARDDLRAVEEALKIGFMGYVTKNTAVAKLVQALNAVSAGQVVLPSRTGSVNGRAEDEEAALMAQQLTPREREVLAYLVHGASGEAIAGPLGISPNTVRTHVQSILTKLQVHSRLEAAAFAVRHQLVTDSIRPHGS